VVPPNDSLDTGWVGCVGFVSVCGFLKESLVCAATLALLIRVDSIVTYKEMDIPVFVGYSNFISAGVQKDCRSA
jgi:hypothetical protein